MINILHCAAQVTNMMRTKMLPLEITSGREATSNYPKDVLKTKLTVQDEVDRSPKKLQLCIKQKPYYELLPK